MTGRIAIDFGTSNTVIARWDDLRSQGEIHHLPEYGRFLGHDSDRISVIPSLIHYTTDKRQWIGNQVIQRGLYQSPRTFRWMKRYIGNRSPVKVRLDEREITPYLAGQDFLTTVLIILAQELELKDEEVAFSVPVEAYEHYENWLTSVAENAGLNRFRLIDEPSAAALGYGAHIQPGSVYLVFDFGGGTMHAAVVRMEEDPSAKNGRRCRVLGKAGRDIGGSAIDQWIFEDVLASNQREDSEETIRRLSNAILVECERMKEELSFKEQVDFTLMNPDTGEIITAEFTRNRFEEILDAHDLLAQVNGVIRSAINKARERGYDEDAISAVLMVGGSSLIPAVQKTVRTLFGKDRVFHQHPFDAIARGAAAFAAGMDFFDHIQHDYAIRYINPETGKYEYHPLVERGTAYPTEASVARLAVKAAFDGQNQLGLAIFEMGDPKTTRRDGVELVFDPGGAARIVPISADDHEQRTLFWMNEHSPTFLHAAPPATRGEPRFDVEFYIDQNKRLTITARDMITGKQIYNQFPVVRLT